MKKHTFYLLISLITSVVFAGHEVGGGGIAENNVLYAYHHLDAIIDLCFHSHGGCSLEEKETLLLSKIRSSLPEEKKTVDQIVFLSEAKNPGFFIVEGQVRIAKTAYRIGAPIHFNQDLMYPKEMAVPTSTGLVPNDRPLDIPLAAAILIHELGHHQGEKNHTFLDLLGTKVQSVLRVYTQELDGGPEARYLISNAYEYQTTGTSDLIVRDGEKIVNLTPYLLSNLKCPSGYLPLQYSFWNLHWMQKTEFSGKQILPLRIRISMNCSDSIFVKNKEEREAVLSLLIERKENAKFIFLKQPKSVEILDCRENPANCN